MPMHRLAALAALALLATASAAQQELDNQLDNLIHDRHTHKHGEPHETVVDPERFTTSRQSSVTLGLPADEEMFTFVVFGDRTGGPDAGVNILADAVHNTNLLEPDLVMTVGDMIDGYNQTPEWMAEMREFKGIMDELLCPWFPVAGNHDTYWRGPDGERPVNDHDANYEMHFGPLWYAFEHKNCLFIALYSDEGDLETGVKNFRRPESQKMSPEQFAWLDETLSAAEDMDHIFVFLHHPRWLKGGYGDDWDRVHNRLVEAGNVSAVFAGHIHRMRHDGPFNGIEYVTLATVGGGQRGLSPDAGYLHHFNVITVRKDQIAMASLPVGEVQDVRAITGQMSDEVGRLANTGMVMEGPLEMTADGEVAQDISMTLRNPTTRPVRAIAMPHSDDSRWWFTPDHTHITLEPGEERTLMLQAMRMGGGTIDRAFRMPEVAVGFEYLADGFAYAVPEKRMAMPLRPRLAAPAQPTSEAVLATGENAAAVIDSALIDLPQGPFTLECWMRAESFGSRVGLVAKTQGSEYGFFVNNGQPSYSVHLDGSYTQVNTGETVLGTGRWYHLAGVFDGEEIRLYVDGQLVDAAAARGERTTNSLPLIVGADVDDNGNAVSAFDGQIDEVRLSTGALYTDTFTPARRLSATDATLLLLHMDEAQGPFLYDTSGKGAHAIIRGDAAVVKP